MHNICQVFKHIALLEMLGSPIPKRSSITPFCPIGLALLWPCICNGSGLINSELCLFLILDTGSDKGARQNNNSSMPDQISQLPGSLTALYWSRRAVLQAPFTGVSLSSAVVLRLGGCKLARKKLEVSN